VNKIKLAKT